MRAKSSCFGKGGKLFLTFYPPELSIVYQRSRVVRGARLLLTQGAVAVVKIWQPTQDFKLNSTAQAFATLAAVFIH